VLCSELSEMSDWQKEAKVFVNAEGNLRLPSDPTVAGPYVPRNCLAGKYDKAKRSCSLTSQYRD
jgi:hypothetical protein